jgi:thiosulfate/3-mercaptopyruvate sulfurtransferase
MKPAPSKSMATSPLVDAAWLRDHLSDVVVLDASIERGTDADGGTHFRPGRAIFEQGHIPQARFADLFESFSDPTAEFAFTRPSAAQIEKAARDAGIDNESVVVAYDSLGGAWAARLWWVLRSFGLVRVHVLNGGLMAWTAIGGEIEAGPAAATTPGDFVARPLDGYFVGKQEVMALLGDGASRSPLVCGVRREQYTGEGSADPRAGHIPGSINLPYNALLDEEGAIDLARARNLARRNGIDSGGPAVLYCGGGVNAAGLALALEAVGLAGSTVYDGSLNEWKADPSLPLVRGEE